jgi:hypothetical protein
MTDPKISSWRWWKVQHRGAPRWFLAAAAVFVLACVVAVVTHLH